MEKEIKLKEYNGTSYWVKGITEDFNNELKHDIYIAKISKNSTEFKNKYNIELIDVEAFGDVKVSEEFISKYIPFTIYHPFGNKEVLSKSCMCYAIKNFDITPYSIKYMASVHYDCKSSWNCLLELLNNPKFTLIYKKHDTI